MWPFKNSENPKNEKEEKAIRSVAEDIAKKEQLDKPEPRHYEQSSQAVDLMKRFSPHEASRLIKFSAKGYELKRRLGDKLWQVVLESSKEIEEGFQEKVNSYLDSRKKDAEFLQAGLTVGMPGEEYEKRKHELIKEVEGDIRKILNQHLQNVYSQEKWAEVFKGKEDLLEEVKRYHGEILFDFEQQKEDSEMEIDIDRVNNDTFHEAFPLYERFRYGSSVIATCVIDGKEKILLGRRMKSSNRGKWILPGGGIDEGESIFEAASREAGEEAGVEITNPKRFLFSVFNDANQDRVIYWVKANIENPEHIEGGGDLSEPALFSKEELAQLDNISDVVRPVLIMAGWLPVDENFAKKYPKTKVGTYLTDSDIKD